MLLGFLTFSAVASCKRWSRCRFHVLWLLALTCNPPPSLMTVLTSDPFHETCALLPPFRSSCNIRWPDLKNLRLTSPSLSPRAMTLLPSGKIYSDWTWCERELHSDVLLLPLDRSVKIYSSEHQVPFSPVRKPLLEDIPTSIFSLQTSFRYTPPGICSLMPSLLDFDDQRIYVGSVNTLWIRHGNVGFRRFCLNSTLSCSSNLVKFLSHDTIIKAVCSSLSNLTQPCLPVSAICAQQLLHPIDPSVSCSSWSRTIMELEMKRPATELCNLGLELLHYLFGAITGINPQSSSRSPYTPSALTSEKIVARLFQKWSFSKLEDCSPLVFSLLKRLIKFPHAKDHERSFPHVLLLLGENLTIKTPLHERYSSLGSKANEYCCFPYRLLSCVMVRLGPKDTTRLIPMRPEVLEHSTSRHTVTIFKSERFKERSNFFIWLLAGGTFETNLDILSNLFKFVSLSLHCFAFDFPKKTAHHLFDVAFIHVIS